MPITSATGTVRITFYIYPLNIIKYLLKARVYVMTKGSSRKKFRKFLGDTLFPKQKPDSLGGISLRIVFLFQKEDSDLPNNEWWPNIVQFLSQIRPFTFQNSNLSFTLD